MAWERELCRFIWVLAVVRDRAPCLRHWVSWGGRPGEDPAGQRAPAPAPASRQPALTSSWELMRREVTPVV